MSPHRGIRQPQKSVFFFGFGLELLDLVEFKGEPNLSTSKLPIQAPKLPTRSVSFSACASPSSCLKPSQRSSISCADAGGWDMAGDANSGLILPWIESASCHVLEGIHGFWRKHRNTRIDPPSISICQHLSPRTRMPIHRKINKGNPCNSSQSASLVAVVAFANS